MRRACVGWRCLGAALLVLTGCTAAEKDTVKPPLREEYNLPPDDPRYSSPVVFPKETLNTPPKSLTPSGPPGFKGPGGMSGGGMSGRGY